MLDCARSVREQEFFTQTCKCHRAGLGDVVRRGMAGTQSEKASRAEGDVATTMRIAPVVVPVVMPAALATVVVSTCTDWQYHDRRPWQEGVGWRRQRWPIGRVHHAGSEGQTEKGESTKRGKRCRFHRILKGLRACSTSGERCLHL